MAVTGELQWDLGPLTVSNSSTTELHYILTSDDPANDERDDAAVWMINNAPQWVYGLVMAQVDVPEMLHDAPLATPPLKQWSGVVRYKNPDRVSPKPLEEKNPPDNEIRLSIRSGTGESNNRLYSKELVEEVFEPGNLLWRWDGYPEVDRSLNVEVDTSEDNGTMFTIKGIPQRSSSVELVVETLLPNTSIVTGYLLTAASYADRHFINEKPWRGFPAGSLKLLTVDSTQRGSLAEGSTDLNVSPWNVVYTIVFQANLTAAELNANLPPGLKGQVQFANGKRGWDYLDITYVDDEFSPNQAATFLIPTAKRASIHKLYDEIDFATLWI
jgi:hypothetical protein